MNLITKYDTSSRRIAAVGMYDGVHAGHRFLIDYLGVEARSRGLVPSVVTFSRHPLSVVRPLEAPALLNTLDDRVRLLSQAGAQDVILLSFNESLRRMSAKDFLSILRKKFAIEALVVGFNNRLGHDLVDSMEQYRTIGREVGVEVIAAPEYRGPFAPVSSSAIRRHLIEGRPEEAAKLLGSPYSLRGKVINGKKLGRTLGFPTANLALPPAPVLIPKIGVYAAYVTTPDGVRRQAVVNIGYRPTVSEDGASSRALSIEAHIIDFIGYIYDEEITVDFISYLRAEKAFPTTARLAAQVKDDIAAAKKQLKDSIASN